MSVPPGKGGGRNTETEATTKTWHEGLEKLRHFNLFYCRDKTINYICKTSLPKNIFKKHTPTHTHKKNQTKKRKTKILPRVAFVLYKNDWGKII